MDTEKQRQLRHDDMRLTESRNDSSKQLLMMPTESLTNREWLPGEFLSGSERRKPGWFLDMKYQTCFGMATLGPKSHFRCPKFKNFHAGGGQAPQTPYKAVLYTKIFNASCK